MVSLQQALSDRFRDFVCTASQPAAEFAGWLDGAISTVSGLDSAGLPGFDINTEIRGLVCPSPGGASGGAGVGITYPPVTPILGQCDGVVYVGTWLRERADGFQQLAGIPPIFGPLEDIIRDDSGPTVRARAVCRGAASGSLQPPGTLVTIATFSSAFEFASVVEINPVRQDGLPDDCGGNSPQQPPTGTAPVTYDDPDGNPVVDEPWDFLPDFPFRLPDGSLIIPFVAVNGNLTINAEFNVSIDEVKFTFGGKGGQDACCPKPEDEDMAEDSEGDPPPPVDETRLWGVKTVVTFDTLPVRQTQIVEPGQPNLYAPDLGAIRFAIEVGGRRAWTADQKIRTVSQFTPVNAPATAYDYSIIPRPGISIQDFPVVVEV